MAYAQFAVCALQLHIMKPLNPGIKAAGSLMLFLSFKYSILIG